MNIKSNCTSVEYKGYTVVQSDYNHHVTIINSAGKRIFHAQVHEPKTESELIEYVDFYLSLINGDFGGV